MIWDWNSWQDYNMATWSLIDEFEILILVFTSKWQKYFYNSSQSHVKIIFLIRENSQNFEFEWNFSHLMRERWQELEAGDMKFGYHGFSLVEREVVHYHSQVMALASLASTKKKHVKFAVLFVPIIPKTILSSTQHFAQRQRSLHQVAFMRLLMSINAFLCEYKHAKRAICTIMSSTIALWCPGISLP